VRWQVAPLDEAVVDALSARLGVRPLTARVLLNRGLGEPDHVGRFLAPRLADLRGPDGIADLPRALDRLTEALGRGERIGVFGDYDVDGVTTAAVLTEALRALGATVVPRVASRFSGYGLSPEEAARFCDEGCTVLLTGDCGTSDHEALAVCRERGVDVIVIDHHQVPSGPSPAYALINPHREDDRFPFKGLASCGVAFYLAASLRSRLRGAGRADGFDPRSLLDLVALGTIADLVPLVHENRILVAAGLKELTARRRPGLRSLGEVAELQGGAISATDVGFRLTPRLNAPGRLGEAQHALDLLLAVGEEEARARAEQVDAVNRERQRIQEEVWQAALVAAEPQAGQAAVVVGDEGWHPGVVGIVAAKLVERFRRPAVVVGFRDGVGRGSARTTGGFDLYRALSACRGHLRACGGHAAAAGLTVARDSFEAFREALVAEAIRHFAERGREESIPVDAVARLAEVDVGLAEELDRLAPFGMANGEPVLALPGVVVRARRIVGNGHLQLTLSAEGAVADAIGFGMADVAPGEGSVVDVLTTVEVDTFRGYRRARLRVKHLLPGGA
jgi:single-stranded-DNA-specific exonuclease